MSGARQTAIRELLKQHDGLTVTSIRDRLSMRVKDGNAVVAAALKAMPDVYIDRWVRSEGGHWAAVWAVVEVPEDCPRPE